MYTDASTFGLGVVLSQCDKKGKNFMTAYAIRSINSAEASYTIKHLETLAVVWGFKHFPNIILGYEITLYTDNAAANELLKTRGRARLHACDSRRIIT